MFIHKVDTEKDIELSKAEAQVDVLEIYGNFQIHIPSIIDFLI